MQSKRRFFASLSWLLSLALFILCCPVPCAADITPDLLDPQLELQYDWAMYMDVHDMKGYLSYPTSRLNHLTDLRVIYRPLARGIRGADAQKARVYEEFWYNDEMPVGLHRFQQLQIASNKFGIIYVQPKDGESDHTPAIANALVRIMVDLWLNNIIAGYVVVPYNQYDQMVSALSRYGFFPRMSSSGSQLSMHLRSNPSGRDNLFYFQKGYDFEK